MEESLARIVIGTLAFFSGLLIATLNIFFYEQLRRLKNKLGRILLGEMWTGKFSSLGSFFDRVIGILFGLFFLIWGILILLHKID